MPGPAAGLTRFVTNCFDTVPLPVGGVAGQIRTVINQAGSGDTTVTLTNVVLTGNAACGGGGIDSQGTLTLMNVTISGNTTSVPGASGCAGGGIFTSGTLTVTNSTISGNSASGNGGGINNGSGNTALTNLDLYSFFAYPMGFTGGVFVAAADLNGDGKADIITGAGPGGGPHVQAFDGATGGLLGSPIGSFFAYSPLFAGDVFVAGAP